MARGAAAEEQASHRRCLTKTNGRDRALNVLHGIVDGQTRRDATARRVDVEVDILLGILRFEKEELGDYGGGGRFFDFAIEADDTFFE